MATPSVPSGRCASAGRVNPGAVARIVVGGADTTVRPPVAGSSRSILTRPATGQLTGVETPFGVRTEHAYDELGRLSGTVTAELLPAKSEFTYAYDAAGQRTRQGGTTGTIDGGYDERRQLTGAQKEAGSGGTSLYSFG